MGRLAAAVLCTLGASLTFPAVADEALTMHGDFRLRYEHNDYGNAQPSWSRGVLRGRLGAAYQVNDAFEIGARLVTGDPDNPRTADFTVGEFAEDFEVSLDQAYATFRRGGLTLTAGKFAKPFSSTELVWDGDVNPQGIGGRYDYAATEQLSGRVAAVYFIIDDNIVAGDSHMQGAQLSTNWHPDDAWAVDFHAAYYDYVLGPLSPEVQSRARGNNIGPDGVSLLSDFDLLDIIGSVEYSGFGDRWGVRLVGNYVRNLGAAVPEDSGYGLDVFAGRLDRPGDFLFQYGYAQTETDAVLGFFSHDNIELATNYREHTLTVAYELMEHTFLGLTHYRYRRLEPDAESSLGDDWIGRTRLNLWFSF
jgi:hypothetical protein